MVRDSDHAYLVACDSVNQRIPKAPHHKTLLAIAPNHAEARMLEQQADGVFELLKQRL